MMRLGILLTTTADAAMNRGNGGTDNWMSAKRISATSSHPRVKPATMPMVQPTHAERHTTPRATSSDVRIPADTQANTSRPRGSVPSKCFPVPGGLSMEAKSWADGLPSIRVPTTLRRTMRTSIPTPTLSEPLILQCRSAAR